MATKIENKAATQPAIESSESKGEVATIGQPRLPYHPAVEERFGVDRSSWRALTDAIFPLAKSADSIILALSYCKRRNLDPFKRVVHIVPMWDNEQRRMVETVWPGIAELRTTAFRTHLYAGREATEYGPDKTEMVGTVEMTYPTWCQITVLRLVEGQRIAFPGPRVYWREAYATAKRDDPSPNAMWRRRPHGQLEKCAEAAALRAAFPEEIGNEYAAEEMEGGTLTPGADGTFAPSPDAPPRPTRAAYTPARPVRDIDPRAAGHEDPDAAYRRSMGGTIDDDTGEIIDEPDTGAAAPSRAAGANQEDDADAPTADPAVAPGPLPKLPPVDPKASLAEIRKWFAQQVKPMIEGLTSEGALFHLLDDPVIAMLATMAPRTADDIRAAINSRVDMLQAGR